MSRDSLLLAIRWQRDAFQLEVDTRLSLAGTTAIIGPSGSGKTSLLRLIAGLERPDAGEIRYGETLWTSTESRVFTPAHKRLVGYMFQDARLFPHLSVSKNLDYAETRRLLSDHAYNRTDVILATGIADLLDRRPDTLSGGEIQRVALARTLLRYPDLLLLDEPLASVDPVRKTETLSFICRVLRQFQIPALYVTHDYSEALRVAEAVIVLQDGQMSDSGAITDIFNKNLGGGDMRASGIGAVLEGQVGEHDPSRGITRVRLSDHDFSIPLNEDLRLNETIRLMIDPRDVALAVQKPEAISIQNQLAGRIETIAQGQSSAECEVRVRLPSGAAILARITAAARIDLKLQPGQSVYALIKTVRVVN